MKRQKETVGAILEIKIENQYYTYAQILSKGTAFFDLKSEVPIKNFTILNDSKILFIVTVYKDIITQGLWLKVGKIPVRTELNILPMQFIQDPINPQLFRLYNPNTGEMKPASKAECKGLEVAAVYEAEYVEERISDYYAGRVNLDRQNDLAIFDDL